MIGNLSLDFRFGGGLENPISGDTGQGLEAHLMLTASKER